MHVSSKRLCSCQVSEEEKKDDIWTIKRTLDWTSAYLTRKGDANPRVSAEWLLSEACGLTRIDLYMNPERPLDREELGVLHEYVLRRGKGEPLQYITGEAPFRYLSVKVRPGVLIPRPETEVLVSEALACLPPAAKREASWNAEASAQEAAAIAEWKARIEEALAVERGEVATRVAGHSSKPVEAEDPIVHDENGDARSASYFLVADICTGTGCIACSIASERPDTRVIAVDLSSDAVSLARENAETLGLSDSIKVIQGDLGEPIPERYLGRFDLVVSNPPYVPTGVLREIPREVSEFEPMIALDGGADGLDLFRRLAPWARRALKPEGAFACELHETHLDAAAAIAREAGFERVRAVRDLADRPRVLICRL